MEEICADLRAETVDLVALCATLGPEGWHTPTPAAGWDVFDQVNHLAQADHCALLAARDPDAFEALKPELLSGRRSLERAADADVDAMDGAALLAWFSDLRASMIAAFEELAPRDRIPWFGPSMGARSFATARLMETWAHGQDVADALGAVRTPTSRLRHVAHIGVTTRGWSYANRGRQVPAGDVRVELAGPDGDTWTWGPDDAADRVVGDALDFCLVVTQRRNVTDTGLTTTGDAATEWMTIAQAFAGPPTDHRAPGAVAG
ncbi:MAG: TIGR03084 family metal-binding protein [Actinomycetota bacterium]|nr:TIGR03084 family metal-binding protein [Actinomycetota bacterium]